MARLDFHDLIVRGFVRSHLPKFSGWCSACDDYRTFGWWASPPRIGGFDLVACCDSCKCLARGDERHVLKHEVVRQQVAS